MIDNIVFWNIRSVNTQNAFERLLDLNRRHHFHILLSLSHFKIHQKVGGTHHTRHYPTNHY
ncbi:hypothetical protein H5410_050000 [Solanum commersonii]|uniref:Uncharacterized protein n=1 Tax=Solanum commersonii TaxID=4109 RepID=A0A9J5WVT8_SOLCO|nr:hypothetical protein H5410_050000 [Solanum commersonii]